MNKESEASRAISAAHEHIQGAIRELYKVVVERCDGSDRCSKRWYSAAMAKLLAIKGDFDEARGTLAE